MEFFFFSKKRLSVYIKNSCGFYITAREKKIMKANDHERFDNVIYSAATTSSGLLVVQIRSLLGGAPKYRYIVI